MSFSNKVVLITGGSSGIGAATPILFAREGANVAIVGRNEKKLKRVDEKCAKVGNRPLIIKADLTNDDDVKKIVKVTIEQFRKLDVLINNAGMIGFGDILDGKALEAYDSVMSVNILAVVNITTLAAPDLVESKGQIVNISSVASRSLPFKPELMPYSVSKAALDHFTKSIALELAPAGVKVNSVSPGPVITDGLENTEFDENWDDLSKMTALKRASDPEEIANLIIYIVNDKAKGMTGSNVVYDNGYLLNN